MKQGKNLILMLLVVMMLLSACGNKTVVQEPVSSAPPAVSNDNLKKGEAGKAMLDHFKENKEVQVAIYLEPFMLDTGHGELRFVPDLIDNKANTDMSLEIVMPDYDMVGVAVLGFVYVDAGDVGRLSTDSSFLAQKMMESDDLLYSIASNKYVESVNAFTISSEKAKAILDIRDVAAQAIKEGKVVTQ